MSRTAVLPVLLCAAACGSEAEQAPPAPAPVPAIAIPTGDLATTGTLPNGVTYAIVAPASATATETQVLLAIRAGAADESPAQQGAAHAIAHAFAPDTLEASAIGQIVTDFAPGTDPDLLGAPLVRVRKLVDAPLPADLAAPAVTAFRTAWYRPDAIAVIVASAAPADQVRAQIARAFGNLHAASAPPPAPPPDAPSPAPAIAYRRADGPVRTVVTYRVPAPPVATEAGQRARMLDRAITNTAAARLHEQHVELECTRAPVSATADDIACSALWDQPGVISAVAIATEIERIRRHGLSHADALAALADYMILPEPGAHTSLGGRYADYFLGAHLPRTPGIAAALTQIAHAITADEVAGAARTDFDPARRRIAIDTDVEEDAAALAVQIASVEATAPPAWDHREALQPIVAPPAAAAGAIAREDHRGDATVWTLANGARVVVLGNRPTGGRVAAFGPGGWASAPPEDMLAATQALRLLELGGLGDVPAATYRAIAHGKDLELGDELRATRHVVHAWVPHAEDLEVAFAAIYAIHARAHADPATVTAWRADQRAALARTSADAATDAADTARRRFIGDAVVPGEWDRAAVDHLDAARAIAAYRALLGDVGGETFVVATDAPIERVRDLAARYLATIPRTPAAAAVPPIAAALPAHDDARTVAARGAPLTPETVTWVAPRAPGADAITDQLDALALEAALGGEDIADHRAYPWSRITDAGHLAFGIEVSGAPADDPATLRDPLLAAMRAIATRGPSISQLARAKEAARTGPRADRWLALVAAAAATGTDAVDAVTADLPALAAPRIDAAHLTATAKRFVHHFALTTTQADPPKPIDL